MSKPSGSTLQRKARDNRRVPREKPKLKTVEDLLALTDEQLKATDPVLMNLIVAKGIPRLANLDIAHFQHMADLWAGDIKKGLPRAERQFQNSPHEWKNSIEFFRLGYLCWYVDERLHIRYREDQRDLTAVLYTDPNDLFLCGVMNTRRGTCGNMAALHVALGWRLGWPVSLACVEAHLICRFDDGVQCHNIEPTQTGKGGFQSHPDSFYLRQHGLPEKAITCGSDLRALTAREMLAIFIGHRARHWADVRESDKAERDHLLARHLFPNNRYLHYAQVQDSIQQGLKLFMPGERGSPAEIADWLREVIGVKPIGTSSNTIVKKENKDVEFHYDETGRIETVQNG